MDFVFIYFFLQNVIDVWSVYKEKACLALSLPHTVNNTVSLCASCTPNTVYNTVSVQRQNPGKQNVR